MMEQTVEIATLTSKMMEIETVMTHLLHIFYITRTIFIPIFINNKNIKEKILAFLLQRVIITTNVIIFYARVSFSELTLLCERK